MQTRKFMLAMIVGLALAIGFVGCATTATPPQELVASNDHAGLVAWYAQEATHLRMHADEIDHLIDQYRQHPKFGKHDHLKHLERVQQSYRNAAEDADALADSHAKMGGS